MVTAAARSALAITAMLVAMLATGAARADSAELCRFDGDRLPEISGLAYSTRHEGIVWAHNDSGSAPRLYAIDIDGCEIRAVLRVRGVEARDPEALAAGIGADGRPVLWWGDIGDNTASRKHVEIHEIPEPARLESGSVTATTYRVRLEERQDAEALLADGDRLWVIGKGLISGTVWKLPHPLRDGMHGRIVGTEEGLVTDAAMRPGGGYAVRDYSEVRIYAGIPPGTLQSRMPLPRQIQGEAMTWTPDGTALIIASEGDDRLIRVAVPGETVDAPDVPSAQASVDPVDRPSTAPSVSPRAPTPVDDGVDPAVAAPLDDVDRVGSLAAMALALGVGVFIVSGAAVAVVAHLRGRQ